MSFVKVDYSWIVDGVTVMGAQLNTTAESLFRTAECLASSPKFGSLRKVFSDPQIKNCPILQLPEIRIDVDDSTCDQLTLTCSTGAVEDDEVNLLIVS